VNQFPGSVLRIVLSKVEEKFSVSEMLETRGVVCHAVRCPGKEECSVAVAVLSLMHAGEVAEVGGRPIRRDSAFVHTGDSRGVV